MNTSQAATEPTTPVAAPGPYAPKHPVRMISAAALFDGHDAAINVMRRILQASGVEVIHLGHNRSVDDVVTAALEEDVQGIALTSYQGGHMEYFKYMREQLDAAGATAVKIYGGGGGVIVQDEIEELQSVGIDRIFSPEDGRNLGLQGMIDVVVKGCDYDQTALPSPAADSPQALPRRLTEVELERRHPPALFRPCPSSE